jgi:hypothetical protein
VILGVVEPEALHILISGHPRDIAIPVARTFLRQRTARQDVPGGCRDAGKRNWEVGAWAPVSTCLHGRWNRLSQVLRGGGRSCGRLDAGEPGGGDPSHPRERPTRVRGGVWKRSRDNAAGGAGSGCRLSRLDGGRDAAGQREWPARDRATQGRPAWAQAHRGGVVKDRSGARVAADVIVVAAVTGGRLRLQARFRRRHRAGTGDLRFPPLTHLRAAGRRRHDAARLATGGRGGRSRTRDSHHYRGSAAAGGWTIIAGPWSEFQRRLPSCRRYGRGWSTCLHRLPNRVPDRRCGRIEAAAGFMSARRAPAPCRPDASD